MNHADEIFHGPAEIQYALCALCVQIDGHFERLVEAHGGCAVKHDVNSLDQRLLVLRLQAQFRHTHVPLHGNDLVQDTREIQSNSIEDLRQGRRMRCEIVESFRSPGEACASFKIFMTHYRFDTSAEISRP